MHYVQDFPLRHHAQCARFADMEQLRTYLAQHGISQAAFAALIGVNESTVSRYLKGPVKPSWDTARTIEQITKGQVPLSAWAEGDSQ